MFFHYFKIAYRNHSKHKIQSIISLLSLAIAFACVSLATYWSHYGQTYDSFLPGYNRIYKVTNYEHGEIHPQYTTYLRFITHLVENYAEVDKVCGISSWWINKTIKINKHEFPTKLTKITPEAVDMFDIQWVEGNRNMNSWKEDEVAISEEIARKICGKDSPVGQKLSYEIDDQGNCREYQIVAVFKTWSKHSNFTFNILSKLVLSDSPWKLDLGEIYVRLHSKTDPKHFLQKLTADTI